MPSSQTKPRARSQPSSGDEWKLLARSSPAGLALATNPRHRYPRHLEVLDGKLVDVTASILRGESRRLMVFMPPRHGKSEQVSRYFPAWFLGMFPERRVMLTSYGADFAGSWGRKARDLLEHHGPGIFGVGVDQGSAARDRWGIAGHAGGMLTAGMGGRLTGEGAHLLVIDDPVKNAEEAQSAAIQEKHRDWLQSTAYPRLEPGGAIVIVLTRWHEADLAGWLLQEAEEGGEQWEVLSLPAIAEAGDALARKPGKALWPERYDEARLAQIKRTLGTYWFAALYQQRPQPAEGGIFRRADFRYWTGSDERYVLHTDEGVRQIEKKRCRRFATVDVADTEKTTGDYTVVATWALTPGRQLLLLGRARVRFEGPDLPRVAVEEYEAWKPSVIKVERAMYGRHLIKQLRKRGLPIQPLEAETDKVTRALTAAARYEGHDIFHPRGADWLRDWEDELATFPNSAHDDQVDTVAYAARAIADMAIDTVKQKEQGTTRTGGMRSQRF